MTRYIENLPDLPVDVLKDIYVRGKNSIDSCAAQGDIDTSPYTVSQIQFVAKLIEQKGGTIPEVA